MSATAARTAPPRCGARSPSDFPTRETARRPTAHRPAANTPATIDRAVILLTTLIGGAVSSLVKSGTEPNLPARAPGEVPPPAANLDVWLPERGAGAAPGHGAGRVRLFNRGRRPRLKLNRAPATAETQVPKGDAFGSGLLRPQEHGGGSNQQS